MKSISLALLTLCLAVGALAGEESKDELTGILKRNVKALSPNLLQIDGGTSIGVRGDALRQIPDGTRIWVKGEIHSAFYDNSSDPTPAMASQWHLYMDVHACRPISKAYERGAKTKQNHRDGGNAR